MSPLRFLLLASFLFSCADAVEADGPRWRALESDLQAAREQARHLQLDQELLEERVHQIELQLEKVIAQLGQLQSNGASSLTPWQQQTDRNIATLQRSLQALASALAKPAEGTRQQPASELYTVQKGDSLEKIARRFHTSTQLLRQLNELNSSKIQVGQKLKVPPIPPTP